MHQRLNFMHVDSLSTSNVLYYLKFMRFPSVLFYFMLQYVLETVASQLYLNYNIRPQAQDLKVIYKINLIFRKKGNFSFFSKRFYFPQEFSSMVKHVFLSFVRYLGGLFFLFFLFFVFFFLSIISYIYGTFICIILIVK